MRGHPLPRPGARKRRGSPSRTMGSAARRRAATVTLVTQWVYGCVLNHRWRTWPRSMMDFAYRGERPSNGVVRVWRRARGQFPRADPHWSHLESPFDVPSAGRKWCRDPGARMPPHTGEPPGFELRDGALDLRAGDVMARTPSACRSSKPAGRRAAAQPSSRGSASAVIRVCHEGTRGPPGPPSHPSAPNLPGSAAASRRGRPGVLAVPQRSGPS